MVRLQTLHGQVQGAGGQRVVPGRLGVQAEGPDGDGVLEVLVHALVGIASHEARTRVRSMQVSEGVRMPIPWKLLAIKAALRVSWGDEAYL